MLRRCSGRRHHGTGGAALSRWWSIIPPYTNLALSTIKNSSLAVAIGYPDVVMVANTAMSQTGQAIECVTIIAVVYLAINLLTSLALNAFNQRSAFITR